ARRRTAPVMMRTARLICALFAVSVSGSACAGTDAPDDTAGAVPGDTAAAADTSSAIDAADAGPEGWQTANGITYRQNRTIDLTGDGRNESVIATASGPAYDSLQVAITIEDARRDTLWHESWPS